MPLETELMLAVEQVGNVGFLEPGHFGQVQASKLVLFTPLPESPTETFLQCPDSSELEYNGLIIARCYSYKFYSIKEIQFLTCTNNEL